MKTFEWRPKAPSKLILTASALRFVLAQLMSMVLTCVNIVLTSFLQTAVQFSSELLFGFLKFRMGGMT